MPTLKRRREQSTNKQGRNFRSFYQSARWHRLSKDHRKKHPLCERDKKNGKTIKAEVVDHIVPLVIWVDEYNQDPYNHINLQSLCKSCHSIKTIEDRKVKDWDLLFNQVRKGVFKSLKSETSETAVQPNFSARNV